MTLPDPENLDAEQPPERSWTAVVGVVLAVLVFCAMVGAIFYRNLSYDPPGMLVIEGVEFYANAVVTVEAPGQLPSSKTLLADEAFEAQFPVKPGLYSVRVERGGQVYLLTQVRVLEHQRQLLELRPPPETAPSKRGR